MATSSDKDTEVEYEAVAVIVTQTSIDPWGNCEYNMGVTGLVDLDKLPEGTVLYRKIIKKEKSCS